MFGKRLAWVLWAAFLGLAGVLPAHPAQRLVVFAAGSLTDPFKEFKSLFEARRPGVEVELNLAASPELRTQIELDAPCDVFASADLQNMQELQEKNLVETPRIFARNKVCVIVPKANRKGVRTLQDLARPGIRIDGGVENLPVSRYMVRILDNLERSGKYGKDFKQKVLQNTLAQEVNVKHIVAKITMDEFDAGFVFVSDVTPAVRKEVSVIAIPDKVNVVARYPIAVVKSTRARALAHDFLKTVLSPQGQQILKRYGFIKP